MPDGFSGESYIVTVSPTVAIDHRFVLPVL